MADEPVEEWMRKPKKGISNVTVSASVWVCARVCLCEDLGACSYFSIFLKSNVIKARRGRLSLLSSVAAAAGDQLTQSSVWPTAHTTTPRRLVLLWTCEEKEDCMWKPNRSGSTAERGTRLKGQRRKL